MLLLDPPRRPDELRTAIGADAAGFGRFAARRMSEMAVDYHTASALRRPDALNRLARPLWSRARVLRCGESRTQSAVNVSSTQEVKR